MNISVFQALTLLAQKYRDNPRHEDKYKAIKSLYVSGTGTEEENDRLEALLHDEVLEGYTVCDDRQTINTDPVRRYFESQLAYYTLPSSIDALSLDDIEEHLEIVLYHSPLNYRNYLSEVIFQPENNPVQTANGPEKEFSEAIRILEQENSYPFLKPESESDSAHLIWIERKKKMSLLVKSVYASVLLSGVRAYDIPLIELYEHPSSLFSSKHRGRTRRLDPVTLDKQRVYPHTLGIMRSYMPLPSDDVLLSPYPSQFVRPTDAYTYMEDSYTVPDAIFATKLTPFVASISGTMLAVLRVHAFLLKNNEFVYKTNKTASEHEKNQLKNYLRSMVSFLIYFSGGHSLKEFVSPIEFERIQYEFRKLPGFKFLNLEYLFKEDNQKAFEEAVSKTFIYNKAILARKEMHMELQYFSYYAPVLRKESKAIYENHRTALGSLIQSMKSMLELYQQNTYRLLMNLLQDFFRCSNLTDAQLNLSDTMIEKLNQLLMHPKARRLCDTGFSRLEQITQELRALCDSMIAKHLLISKRTRRNICDTELDKLLVSFKKDSEELLQKIRSEVLPSIRDVDEEEDEKCDEIEEGLRYRARGV